MKDRKTPHRYVNFEHTNLQGFLCLHADAGERPRRRVSYEKLFRLAETRLAQNLSNYLRIV